MANIILHDKFDKYFYSNFKWKNPFVTSNVPTKASFTMLVLY